MLPVEKVMADNLTVRLALNLSRTELIVEDAVHKVVRQTNKLLIWCPAAHSSNKLFVRFGIGACASSSHSHQIQGH